ncbi:hypothetical protein PR202_gb23308 [Eleusine coracana subsp. coracana]|uniref:EIF-2B GDP-GTP exchange factor subunit epsilon n=1 Tax=Eleusine coracana subsp. coracana TaxID=191504 RepID=A0AAV5FIL6_ELECO|nr:hypothetical protein PR202_gb23308 [Eleusine coracana subsp. coracana]
MSSKKSRGAGGAGDDYEDLTRPPPLQAILLADSFTFKFRPITLERPKVLLPLVNMPMIEYTLTWLETAGVEDVFVFCCSHAHQVKEYLDKAGWTGKTVAGSMSVSAVESHDAISAGDALRVMYDRGVIHGDFVLISGDTISNMSLKDALQEHKDRRKKDSLAVMTMIIKHSKPDMLTNETCLGNDEIVMAINPETNELHYYEDRVDSSRSFVTIDKDILSSNPSLVLHNDMEIMGYKIYTHEIHSSYAARIDNFRSYDTGIYKASDVILSHSAQIGANSVVGSATNIGDNCKISNSVIGEGCKIGKNVVINGSYIWDNVIIEDECKVSYSLICDGVHLRAGAVVEFGSILSFKVEVGKNVTIPAHSKVSLLSQPSNEDSDEELEYADTSSGVTDSPSLSSTRSNGDQVTAPSEEEDSGTSDETGTSGVVGYIWTSGDSGVLDEWRQSIAPIPKEKLEEMRHACSAGDDDGSEGELNNPTVPDSDNESAGAIDDEDDPFAKFEKEVSMHFPEKIIMVDCMLVLCLCCRLSYSLQHADCAGAVFYSVMKSALVAAQSTNGKDFLLMNLIGYKACDVYTDTLLKTTAEALGKWKDLLRNYAKTVDEEVWFNNITD